MTLIQLILPDQTTFMGHLDHSPYESTLGGAISGDTVILSALDYLDADHNPVIFNSALSPLIFHSLAHFSGHIKEKSCQRTDVFLQLTSLACSTSSSKWSQKLHDLASRVSKAFCTAIKSSLTLVHPQ